jgi:hypothetical protein
MDATKTWDSGRSLGGEDPGRECLSNGPELDDRLCMMRGTITSDGANPSQCQVKTGRPSSGTHLGLLFDLSPSSLPQGSPLSLSENQQASRECLTFRS